MARTGQSCIIEGLFFPGIDFGRVFRLRYPDALGMEYVHDPIGWFRSG